MQIDFKPTVGNVVEVAEFLRRQVNIRTSTRVKDLDVQIEGTNGDTSVILRGRSDTYYVKQLAQQPLIELQDDLPGMLGITHSPKIQNKIEVK